MPSGCLNSYCPGFVQTSTKIPPDLVLRDIHGPEGPVQYIYQAVSMVPTHFFSIYFLRQEIL